MALDIHVHVLYSCVTANLIHITVLGQCFPYLALPVQHGKKPLYLQADLPSSSF